MKKIIGIDWLQVSGSVKSIEGFFGNNTVKQVKLGDVYFNFEYKNSSSDFENIVNVSFVDCNGVIVDLGILATGWRLRKDVDLCSFKVYNEILYTLEYKYIAKLIRLFFNVRKISRIDFYCDFLNFSSLDCETFIKQVASCKFLTGHGSLKKSIVMKGISYESLTIGSRNSNCRYYLYNKTKELEGSNKDYISLGHNYVFGENKEVWRVEFSLLRPDNILLDWFRDDKDFLALSDFDCVMELCSGDSFSDLFYSIFCRFFKFKTGNLGLCFNSEYFLDFSNFCSTYPVKIRKRKSGKKKTEKMFLKCLDNLNTELRSVNFRKRNFSEIIDYFIETRNLHKFARKNGLYPKKNTLSKTCVKNE